MLGCWYSKNVTKTCLVDADLLEDIGKVWMEREESIVSS